ncbi:MAG: hypothetical protein C0594_14855 [Marinilabiliales bacterium]|nr:MAG: hypothetical protein C0594_14855 [Marinilabiliales bacterium]
MAKKNINIDPRKYMKMAVEVMISSIQEPRTDKSSPKVGAVLIKSDGSFDTAFRGELRHGDHAEFTVIERKNRDTDLSGALLFATLEPCAPGARNAPKLSCSERIVNARISEVWIGIEDHDPTVNHAGINYLLKHGVKVHQFDRDLQKIIEKENEQFLTEAKKRAVDAKDKKVEIKSILNKYAEHTDLSSLSQEALESFLKKSGSNLKWNSDEFYNELSQMALLDKDKNGNYLPTGNAILLFGKKPRLKFQQSSVKAKVDYGNGDIDVQSFDDAIILIPDQIENWIRKVLPESFDRSTFTREKTPAYPIPVIREAIINALVHRDYNIDTAKIQLEITPDRIVIKSPGSPVSPLKINDLKNFSASSFTRNKKIALVFNEMKLIEETGVGMDTFKSLPEKYSLPLPIIQYLQSNIFVIFPRTTEAIRKIIGSEDIEQLNDEELTGLDFVKLKGEVSRKEYAAHFGFNDRKASRHLSKMRNIGLIGDNGKDVRSKNYKYVFLKDG